MSEAAVTTEVIEATTPTPTPAQTILSDGGAKPTDETKVDTAPTVEPPAEESPKESDVAPTGDVKPFFEAIPDDWRAQAAKSLAGEDSEQATKIERRLGRFNTLADYMKSAEAADVKIRKGIQSQRRPADDASEEEVQAWREANGVPASADKYDLKFGDGVQLSSGDQAIIDALLPTAHRLGLSSEEMSGLGQSFFEAQAALAQKQNDTDGLQMQETETALKQAWGGDYGRNVNVLRAAVNDMPEAVRNEFSSARGSDGRALLNNPNFVNHYVSLYNRANPAAALVPNGTMDASGSIDDQIAEIEKVFREDEPKYRADAAMQEKYRNLLEARDNLKKQN